MGQEIDEGGWSRAARRASAAITAALLALGPVALAQAQCTYNSLASGTGELTSGNPSFFRVDRNQAAWCAIGVRPTPGASWGLALSRGTGAFPTCIGSTAASSGEAGAVNFVVGSPEAALGFGYAGVATPAPAPNARVEWQESQGALSIDAPLVSAPVDESDVVSVWSATLPEDRPTYFRVMASAGVQARLFVFRNPGAGEYWAGRTDRLFEASLTEELTHLLFQAPAPGSYAVVIVNENGGTGTISIGFSFCTYAHAALSDGLPVTQGRVSAHYYFQPLSAGWRAYAVRGDAGNWDISEHEFLMGPFPSCLPPPLAKSERASGVDLVVANFRQPPQRAFGVRAWLIEPGPGTAQTVEYDAGEDSLVVPVFLQSVTSAAGDVIKLWSLHLFGGYRYDFDLLRLSGTGDLRLLLFENLGDGEYFAGRTARILETTTFASFEPWRTDHYGLVVVNENGQAADYRLYVTWNNAVGATPAAHANRLRAIAPNPASGATRIEYETDRAAPVAFEVFDLAGRRVWRHEDAARGAGVAAAEWDGRASAAGRVPPGVYWIRYLVDGAFAGSARIVRLP